MYTVCKSRCLRMPNATKKTGGRIPNNNIYLHGYKFCKKCDLFFKLPPHIYYCQCCGCMLRRGPAHSQTSKYLRDEVLKVVRY